MGEETDANGKKLQTRYNIEIIETQLLTKCREVLSILNNQLLKGVTKNSEAEVFYLKMCGDYYRYIAEFKGEDDSSVLEDAEKAYDKAWTKAGNCLGETHPTRLGLALNFSVCYFEILKKPSEACGLAKKAFDQAIAKLDTLNDKNYKDSTLIMQLLRDNLTLWTSDNDKKEYPE